MRPGTVALIGGAGAAVRARRRYPRPSLSQQRGHYGLLQNHQRRVRMVTGVLLVRLGRRTDWASNISPRSIWSARLASLAYQFDWKAYNGPRLGRLVLQDSPEWST